MLACARQLYLGIMALQGVLSACYSFAFSVVSRIILNEVRTRLFANILDQVTDTARPRSLRSIALGPLWTPSNGRRSLCAPAPADGKKANLCARSGRGVL